MTGYEIYKLCRGYQKRSSPTLEGYKNSKEFGYFEMLANWFVKEKHFPSDDVFNYLNIIYNNNQDVFDPYSIMDEKWNEIYIDWKKNRSTKALYFDTVKKSFIFLTNFCVQKGIDLDKYKKDYAIKHIRENKIDGAVAIYLSLFDKKSLNKVQKILLQDILSKYNIIVVRIRDPELNSLLASSYQEMIKVLEVCSNNTEISKQSNTVKGV